MRSGLTALAIRSPHVRSRPPSRTPGHPRGLPCSGFGEPLPAPAAEHRLRVRREPAAPRADPVQHAGGLAALVRQGGGGRGPDGQAGSAAVDGQADEAVRAGGEGAAGGPGQPGDGGGRQLQRYVLRLDPAVARDDDQEDVQHVLLVLADLAAGRQAYQVGIQLAALLAQLPQRPTPVGGRVAEQLVEYGQNARYGSHSSQATPRRGRCRAVVEAWEAVAPLYARVGTRTPTGHL